MGVGGEDTHGHCYYRWYHVKLTEQRILDEMLEDAEGVSSAALMEGRQSTKRESPTA